MSIRIIAKKSKEDARREAKSHGVKGFRVYNETDTEVVGSCPDNAKNRDAVAYWFIDPELGRNAPFLPGSPSSLITLQ